MGRRCAFCLRLGGAVERDWCGGAPRGSATNASPAAPALVAEAGEGSPKRLRLRPPSIPQTEEAEGAVGSTAFETVFGGGAGVEERLALIEDSGSLRPVVEEVMASYRALGDPDVWVDLVRFVSADEAEVHWAPTLVGGARVPLPGFAVLDDGRLEGQPCHLPADGLDGRGHRAPSRVGGARGGRIGLRRTECPWIPMHVAV